MKVGHDTITFDFDPAIFGALRLASDEFAREMRIAAAVQWYAQGIVSQAKAAEIAGLSRAQFLEELYRRKTPACQVTGDEIREEIMPPRHWIVNASPLILSTAGRSVRSSGWIEDEPGISWGDDAHIP